MYFVLIIFLVKNIIIQIKLILVKDQNSRRVDNDNK